MTSLGYSTNYYNETNETLPQYPPISQDLFEYQTTGKSLPPPASSNFVAIDNGNCSPRFVRSTMYSIPQKRAIQQKCQIPFAIVVAPLAKLHQRESPIPLIDCGENGPIRCAKCGGYISPFTRYLDYIPVLFHILRERKKKK
eukprot:Anaeramoba_flamelloidesc25600_g1_i2.p1 GENE.c25600_g1_i2~~c25600_g1_i2.p1  ORF type:complete len:142 (-),score=16.41 c25600_g1_i2:54-479(-)